MKALLFEKMYKFHMKSNIKQQCTPNSNTEDITKKKVMTREL